MVKKQKKLWAHYEQVKYLLGTYIALFFLVPFSAFCISFLAHSAEIDSGVQDAVKSALLIGLKWYAIIMPIVTVLFIIRFLYNSDTVEFTDTSIKYYRWIFSKQSRSINFNEITKCVISEGLWLYKGEYERGRKIRIFNKDNVILKLDLYYKVCFSIVLKLTDKKVWLVDDNSHLRAIGNYFKIDFINLPYEQQMLLLKYYCKFPPRKYKTGEEVLKNKRKV